MIKAIQEVNSSKATPLKKFKDKKVESNLK